MKTSQRWMALVLGGAMLMAGCGRPSRGAQGYKPPKLPPPPPEVVAMPIDPVLQARAQKLVDEAGASASGLMRIHAIEITQQTRGVEGASVYIKGLSDTDSHVRFAAAVAIGMTRARAGYAALFPHIDDPDQRVQLAVRFALHRLGDYRLSKEIELFAGSGDWSIRAETARLVGLLEESTGLNLLRSMLKDSHPGVRLQVSEAMFRLGDEDARKRIIAGTLSAAPDERITALQAMGLSGDKTFLPHIRGQLTNDYMEVCLAAARAAGMLGSDDGMGVALVGARSSNPVQRQMAAFALGDIGRSDAQPVLKTLLDDKDAETELAAACAILKLKSRTP